ncbi:MAG: hypothetical protein ABJL44_13375 [Algibacter sp.]
MQSFKELFLQAVNREKLTDEAKLIGRDIQVNVNLDSGPLGSGKHLVVEGLAE